jgi:hypothetical protein
MNRIAFAVVAFVLSAPHVASSQDSKDLEFEGDVIEVNPKTRESPTVESMAVKAATAETKIDNYLNESRFKVRSGLEQAFKDFRVILREYAEDDDPPVVNLIKRTIGAVFNMVMIVVPTEGTWQQLFKDEIVIPAMEQLTKEDGGFSGDVNQFLDVLERNYGVHVLDEGMKVYDKFKKSSEYAAATDMFMENFAENTLDPKGSLPADVATVLNRAGVPPPIDETQERTRDCALVALLGELRAGPVYLNRFPGFISEVSAMG